MVTKSTKTGIQKKEACMDRQCPLHGTLSTRGRTFQGVVIATKMQKTAMVEWLRRKYLPKFERYEKKRSRIKAHNPACVKAKEGDIVTVAE